MAVRNSWIIQITSTIVLTFSLVLLGVIFSFIKTSRYAAEKSQQNIKLELFFKEDVNSQSAFQWIEEIKAIPEVLKISFITQEQAQEEFKKMMFSSFGSLTEEASLLSRLPASVSIQFQEGVSSDTKKTKVQEIVTLAQQITTFDGHVYQQDWAEWLGSFTKKAETGIAVLGIFIFLTIFLIISNVIRSQVVHKREEIEIHSFLGATIWQIEKPFIRNSVIIGFVSSLFASSLITGAIYFAKMRLQLQNEIISPEIIQGPNALEVLFVIVIVAAISGWAAHTCVRERTL